MVRIQSGFRQSNGREVPYVLKSRTTSGASRGATKAAARIVGCMGSFSSLLIGYLRTPLLIYTGGCPEAVAAGKRRHTVVIEYFSESAFVRTPEWKYIEYVN
jgi:hypothetical protein